MNNEAIMCEEAAKLEIIKVKLSRQELTEVQAVLESIACIVKMQQCMNNMILDLLAT